MKVEEIRPKKFMAEISKLEQKEIKDFLKKQSQFLMVSCPACTKTDFTKRFIKNGFSFVKCQYCQTLFINPRPTSFMLEEYYATSKQLQYWNDKIFKATEIVRRKKIFKPRAKRVVKLCNLYYSNKKTIVDVGAGFGTFCDEIKKTGFFERVIAIEPSSSLALSCRNKGVEVIEKTIEKVNLSNVDVITCFELIEHLFQPKSFLSACTKALTKNGLLILTIPNIQGFDLQVLGKNSDNINGPNHLNYFNPYSISLLVKRVGLDVINLETPGRLDAQLVRDKALSKQIDLTKQPFLNQILIEKWEELGESFQNFLAKNRLSSHLWLVARKK